MRIRGDRLKQLIEDGAAAREDLVAALVREGYSPARADSAIGNWMKGRDHPRCKARDIAVLAQTLRCDVADIAKFTSQVMYHRGSPRKAGLVVDLVRGKPVAEAINLLSFTPKRAAVNIKKALTAAIADAEAADADVTELFVSESRVDPAPHIKRFQPKDRGRAHPILKRQSHITISVQQRV